MPQPLFPEGILFGKMFPIPGNPTRRKSLYAPFVTIPFWKACYNSSTEKTIFPVPPFPRPENASITAHPSLDSTIAYA